MKRIKNHQSTEFGACQAINLINMRLSTGMKNYRSSIRSGKDTINWKTAPQMP
jgi:hypothetical protein